jgi:FMN reductase
VAEALVEKLLTAGSYSIRVIDLAEYSDQLFTWPSETIDELNRTVAEAGLVIVASPTYKATFTGLLKAFLDRYPSRGLNGVVAIPVMTGADLRHAMGPEVNLRPLLVELGAVVPTQALYFVTDQIERMDDILDEWVVDTLARLRAQLPNVFPSAVPA